MAKLPKKPEQIANDPAKVAECERVVATVARAFFFGLGEDEMDERIERREPTENEPEYHNVD